ncbi:MAG: bifunctional YncE family protein/alkaline phosphatase family protein [Gemmatimonadetes bacterium]|nr:bifunctional YncE family protein/alkaline phosphatase family protein [Gemmatimonadota bacterium]
MRALRAFTQGVWAVAVFLAAPLPATQQLPTGVRLEPAGASIDVGSLPLAMLLSPDRAAGRVVQTLEQPAAFLGLALAPDGRTLYASGGNQDVVYRYTWVRGRAALRDSLVLAVKGPQTSGRRYPSGIGVSPDGRTVYVAENLADSLAVMDVATGRVTARFATERYPYGVAVAPDGTVYVSAWGGHTVSVFRPTAGGLEDAGRITVGRHPSALLLNHDGSRLFAVSGSTDRTAVVDTRARQVIAELLDPAPEGPSEGSTPNALALSGDGARLFVAEADNNAVAVFDLSPETGGYAPRPWSPKADRLAGRIPVGWYPAALALAGDTLLVANGKGRGTRPNPDFPTPEVRRLPGEPSYTMGQLSGTLTTLAPPQMLGPALVRHSATVRRANRWDQRARTGARYPPFEHVIYIIKENRTYDQVFGDMPQGDGDSSLVFFGRAISPNHHALADRFGLFDRFFVNAEVSPDGHNWSMAAYTTDYLQKTVPSNYSDRGRTYDWEGTNRGRVPSDDGDDDVNEPASGYLWDLAQQAGISFRNYGEFVVPEYVAESERMPPGYRGNKPFLAAHTNRRFPGYDLSIPDQVRADVWIAELQEFVAKGELPKLQIVRLPNDHTAGGAAGQPTPQAYMADNDLALGRMMEALSNTPFWRNTVVFVLEDDSQNGPDHVDSHRSPMLVISPYNRPGVIHRWTNTTDVIATMTQILGLGSLSQFDYFGRPLRDIWAATPDLTPYQVLTPAVPLDQKNPTWGPDAEASRGLDLRFEDIADEDLFNRVL